jgi:hypothetical protein
MQEYLMAAPVASLIFVITIIASLLAFSNENLYSKMMLHPYSVSRGQKCFYGNIQRAYTSRLDAFIL